MNFKKKNIWSSKGCSGERVSLVGDEICGIMHGRLSVMQISFTLFMVLELSRPAHSHKNLHTRWTPWSALQNKKGGGGHVTPCCCLRVGKQSTAPSHPSLHQCSRQHGQKKIAPSFSSVRGTAKIKYTRQAHLTEEHNNQKQIVS